MLQKGILMLMAIILPLTITYAGVVKPVNSHDTASIPMQVIKYSKSSLQGAAIYMIKNGNAVFSPKIEEANIKPEKLKKIVVKVRESICSVAHDGKVRFWVEASGKAGGVFVSATIGGGIEITINCKPKK